MTQKMDPAIKAKWVNALKSGAYQQNYNALRYESKHCCLGVLCDLHAKAHGESWDCTYEVEGDQYCGVDSFLPTEVQAWAGLKSHNPVVAGRELASYNDDRRLSFTDIAALIDAHL